jgi:hypothetical protein
VLGIPRVDELAHQHLSLTHQPMLWVEGIDHLRYPGIDALDVGPRQRRLGHHVGLQPNEAQRHGLLVGVAARPGPCRHIQDKPRQVFLIDTHADVQRPQVAHQHQARSRGGCDVLARADVHLQDGAVHGRTHLEQFQVDPSLCHLGAGLIQVGAGNGLVRLPGAGFQQGEVGPGQGHCACACR